jgi:hypothetical protein
VKAVIDFPDAVVASLAYAIRYLEGALTDWTESLLPLH